MPRAARRGISPGLFYGVFAGLCATNVVAVVAFLMSPDIAGLLNSQTDVVLAAYEDRIAQLRVEVDRLHSRRYAQTGDINLQLQELAQQQEVLSEQQQFVRLLAQKANELGIEADVPEEIPAGSNAAAIAPPADGQAATPVEEIAAATTLTDEMISETRLALTAITTAASASTDDILDSLQSLGIRPELPATGEAVGGPLLPPEDESASPGLVEDAAAVMEALTRFKAAKEAIDLAPVHEPLAGEMRISSGFGNRRDPFGGGKAFHAGIDVPAPRGTLVLAAGDGVVTFAGQSSGYGILVEIRHGTGLVTRYAHLSASLVKEGQTVRAGTPIAKVGSTGRSTGPHLHFEVRQDDRSIDPGRFLAVGRRLQQFAA